MRHLYKKIRRGIETGQIRHAMLWRFKNNKNATEISKKNVSVYGQSVIIERSKLVLKTNRILPDKNQQATW